MPRDRDRKIRADERLWEIFRTLKIRDKADAEWLWGRGWKRHFLRLLYYETSVYSSILWVVEHWQETCNAIIMHIEEAFAEIDARTEPVNKAA